MKGIFRTLLVVAASTSFAVSGMQQLRSGLRSLSSRVWWSRAGASVRQMPDVRVATALNAGRTFNNDGGNGGFRDRSMSEFITAGALASGLALSVREQSNAEQGDTAQIQSSLGGTIATIGFGAVSGAAAVLSYAVIWGSKEDQLLSLIENPQGYGEYELLSLRADFSKYEICSFVRDNFERLISSGQGIRAIGLLAEDDWLTRHIVFNLSKEHFSTLIRRGAGIGAGIRLISASMDGNPLYAQELAPFIKKNFEKWIGYTSGVSAIHALIEDDASYIQEFLPLIRANSKRLISEEEGMRLLCMLIEQAHAHERDSLVQELISIATDEQCFEQLIAKEQGWQLICDLVKHDPESFQRFVPLIKSKRRRFSYWLVRELIEQVPSVAQELAQVTGSILEQGTWLPRSFEIKLVQTFLKTDPTCVGAFSGFITSHFDSLVDDHAGFQLICDLIRHNPASIHEFVALFELHLSDIWDWQHEKILELIEQEPSCEQPIFSFYRRLLKQSAEQTLSENQLGAGKLLLDLLDFGRKNQGQMALEQQVVMPLLEYLIDEHPEKISESDVYMAMHRLPCQLKARLLQHVRQRNTDNSIAKLYPLFQMCVNERSSASNEHKNCLKCSAVSATKALDHLLGAHLPEYQQRLRDAVIRNYQELQDCTQERNTATDKHMNRYAWAILGRGLGHVVSDSHFTSLLERAFCKEVELESQGYVAFKHGQRWEYGLPERWLTTLWGVIHEQDVNEYLFMHVKRLGEDAQREADKRVALLRHGRRTDADRQRLLFMNYPLFGNAGNLGSSSARYAFCNNNVGEVSVSLADVFSYLECERVYEKYADELKQLESEYRELSEHGLLLVIGVPKDTLADCVYLTTSGGPKLNIHIDGIGETDDINIIISTLRNAPEKIENSDEIEFVLTMTQDEKGGMNPKSGIKVLPFHAADPEKYAVFTKKEEALLEKIKTEIIGDKVEKSEGVVHEEGGEAQTLLGTAHQRLFEELSLE